MPTVNLDALLEFQLENYVAFLLLFLFRPLGLTYGFTLFSWGFGSGIMLRLAISFSLGLMVFWYNSLDFIEVVRTASVREFTIILMIDFAIGFGSGALASAPFHALKYAGAITDSYRGENNSGIQDPSGGELTTYSVLYFITGAVIFCQVGGFYIIVDNLLSTYVLWPIGSQSVGFSADAWLLAAEFLQRSLMFAIAVAAPLLIIFMSIDFALAVAAKLAPRFGFYENSFLLKNLAAIVSLPMIALYLLRISDSNMSYTYDVISNLRIFLR